MLPAEQHDYKVQRTSHIVGDYVKQIASHAYVPCIEQASLVHQFVMIIREEWQILVKTVHHGKAVSAKWSYLRHHPQHEHKYRRDDKSDYHDIVVSKYILYRLFILLKYEAFAEYIVYYKYNYLNYYL